MREVEGLRGLLDCPGVLSRESSRPTSVLTRDTALAQILLLSPKGEVTETRRFSIPTDRLNMESVEIALGEKLFLSYQVRSSGSIAGAH